ncbi:MAG: SPFH domain-containing protein [Oscillospiraceae bacterium]
MAVIDIVKFDGLASRDWIVYKHPKDNLTMGTQLIVAEGQAAVFLKGGQICDMFTAGTHTLSAANLPILQSIVNLPFGNKTPFTAEIFFINTITKLDIQWGTPDPIQIIDPKYFTKLRLRAFGQMGLKIKDYAVFIRELVGAVNPADMVKFTKISEFFKGILIQKIKVIIANIVINQKISALEISAQLDTISAEAIQKISPEFEKFGFTVVNFFIQSINFPNEDFEQINNILKNRAEFEIMGDNRYVTKRSFDVYDHAASNESGVAGAFAAGGVGVGLGASIGSGMANTVNTAAVLIPTIVCAGCKTENKAGMKFCCECGMSLEKKKMCCPACGAQIDEISKFCAECGTSVAAKKCECGTPLESGQKFCPNCGKPSGI